MTGILNIRRNYDRLGDTAPAPVPVPSDSLISSRQHRHRSEILRGGIKCTGPFVTNATAQVEMSGLVNVLRMIIAHIAMERVISGKNVQDVAGLEC